MPLKTSPTATQTIYLSRIFLNNLERRAQKTLSDPAATHRLIMTGFPDQLGESRVLFRIEPETREARSVVLVQSPIEPRWSELVAETKALNLDLRQGQPLRFRLRANPTRRLAHNPANTKAKGARVGLLRDEEVQSWMERKGRDLGFDVEDLLIVSEGDVKVRRDREQKDHESKNHESKVRVATFRSFLLQGRLRVREPAKVVEAVATGIGSAKAFGFGLLSLAPA